MNQFIQDLKHMADEIREADEPMAEEVRRNAQDSQETSRRMLEAIHKLHGILFLIPKKLIRIAESMERPK